MGPPQPAQPGKVYILSGKLVEQEALDFVQQGFNPGEQIVSVTDVVLNVNGQDCIWSGLSGGDRFGHDLAFAKALGSPSLGEFDGIVVGAPQKLWKSVVVPPDQIDWALFGPGYGSVITAPPSAPIITVTHTDAEPGFTGGDDVWFGESVAGGVDIDENGFTEILVGAPKWDFLDPANPGNDLADAGKVFVIDPIDPGNWTKRVHESSSPGIWFGWSVGAVGPFVDDPAEGRIDYAAGSRLYGEDAFVPPGGCNPAVIDASTAVGVALLDAQQSAGRGCGTTTVFSASSGAAVLKIEGEDGKDSNGWVIVGIPSLYSGKLTGSFVSSSMRWPNAPGDEYGRIYRFDPIFTP